MTTIRRISAGSVFKVVFVIYLLLLAFFGCVGMLVPALLLGASDLFSRLGVDASPLTSSLGGSEIVIMIVLYVLVVVVGALVQALVSAIAALVYNLIAGWVGGIRVELKE